MLWTKTRERGFVNSLVMCDFVPWTPEEWQEALYAATGWRLSPEEMLEVGERTLQLTRLFNLREGISPEEDRLPERFFQPFRKGTPRPAWTPRPSGRGSGPTGGLRAGKGAWIRKGSRPWA